MIIEKIFNFSLSYTTQTIKKRPYTFQIVIMVAMGVFVSLSEKLSGRTSFSNQFKFVIQATIPNPIKKWVFPGIFAEEVMERRLAPLKYVFTKQSEEKQKIIEILNRVNNPDFIARYGSELLEFKIERPIEMEANLIFNAVANLTPENAVPVINKAKLFFNSHIKNKERAEIINYLADMTPTAREIISPVALICQSKNTANVNLLIRALFNWRSVANWIALNPNDTNNLIQPEFSNEERAEIIIRLSRARDIRSVVLETATKIRRERDRGNQISAYNIIGFIEDEVRRPPHMQAAQLAPPAQPRFPGIFMQAFAQGEALAAVAAPGTVSVHKGNRDQKTREALEILKAKQCELSEEQIYIEVDEFRAYLEVQENIELKNKAQRALERAKIEGEIFGPLLTDDTFTIMGYEMPGREVIARMWLFCKTYTEAGKGSIEIERERQNAKQSMVVALSECFDEFNSQVCNPGKVQRLCTRVLQGRLAGVDIDGISQHTPVARITPQLITEMFFTEARRAIESKAQLLAEVDIFCEAHPEISKPMVSNIVEQYANQSALDP
jgi:hypothetical protein